MKSQHFVNVACRHAPRRDRADDGRGPRLAVSARKNVRQVGGKRRIGRKRPTPGDEPRVFEGGGHNVLAHGDQN